jgi:predicted TIM-barrel fold metal-dependent hydrolase
MKVVFHRKQVRTRRRHSESSKSLLGAREMSLSRRLLVANETAAYPASVHNCRSRMRRRHKMTDHSLNWNPPMNPASDQKHNRREFCQRSVLAAAGFTFWGAAAAGDQRVSAQESVGSFKQYPPGRYVDVHTHLGQTWNSTDELSATHLLKWMDENDIAQAIVLPLTSPESSSFLLTTDFVLQETKAHRDRLIPFCSVDPRTSYTGGAKGLVAMLKRWVELGAKGFGEHKPGVRIDDPRNMALYAACQELALPVLFHLDEQRNMDSPGLPGLAKALQEHSQTIFIGHGPGWWASISGEVKQSDLAGYPGGPVALGGAIDALMDKYPNLFGDLSAGSGAGAITRDPKFGREFLIRRADRLMFGTDYLSPGQKVPQIDLYRQIDLPADVAAKIYRENARRVLKL